MAFNFYIENTCREGAGREGRREGGRAGGRESSEGAFGTILMREDKGSWPAPPCASHPAHWRRRGMSLVALRLPTEASAPLKFNQHGSGTFHFSDAFMDN